jgi:hypothetical protein
MPLSKSAAEVPPMMMSKSVLIPMKAPVECRSGRAR